MGQNVNENKAMTKVVIATMGFQVYINACNTKCSQSSFLILSTEQIWIVGDSIVFWAHRRAERTGCADMDLVNDGHPLGWKAGPSLGPNKRMARVDYQWPDEADRFSVTRGHE